MPSQKFIPHRVNPEACSTEHNHPKCDTIYDIEPEVPDLDPYIGPNGLAHLVDHPHEAIDLGNNLPLQNVWLKRFPKKEKTKLTVCPPYQVGIGWGIEFVEGWRVTWLINLVIIALALIAIIFLICWWRYRDDLQAASSMAAFFINCATLFMGAFAAAVAVG